MTNLEVLHEVVERAGRLRSVSAARFEGLAHFVTQMVLSFDKMSLLVATDPDDDSIILRLDEFAADRATTVHDVSSSALWTPAIGLGLRWAWELRNHQGYADGVRFEFASPDGRASRRVEFIVAGSALQALTCEPSSDSAA